jgi:hypothetical protein
LLRNIHINQTHFKAFNFIQDTSIIDFAVRNLVLFNLFITIQLNCALTHLLEIERHLRCHYAIKVELILFQADVPKT